MDWQLVLDSIGPIALGAITGTIPLTLASFSLGLVIAIGMALARISGIAWLSGLARAYISIIRGTPMLVQLFVIFYGMPQIGITLDPWPSAIIALSLNVGGYAAEIIRAAILSIPRGQWEAAAMIGMSRGQALGRIVLPQAARVSVPPLSNTFISLVKDTSLASVILVTELFRVAQRIAAPSGEFLTIYLVAAAVYWVICLVLAGGQDRLERKLDRYAV
ncbi:ABC transporter permease subunit [Agrococcus sp. Marseille-Q4369]|uniref:amino acid ABC transporter permease n=1 Tax=unclassified Agrococcus TaxID=2615065 RepID=UPI001B8B1ADD|nr:ABC transporter permease subunit [Agrococcus sp. Marseille-Q4369]QUW19133.1 ABC transporter permease subunit [Agrococcus sp. Marseille-Q4369]